MTHHLDLLRTAPLPGEVADLPRRAPLRKEAKALRSCWHWRNHQPRHDSGNARADAEVLLNAAGRQILPGIPLAEPVHA
jgi:hypothetical protein